MESSKGCWDGLRIHTWNVQGLGDIPRGTLAGAELLRNFAEPGEYDFLFLQEHKLMREKIPFVSRRLKFKKAFWTPAKKGEKGNAKGGLAIAVGDKFADKIVDAGVDKKNAFLCGLL